MSKEIIGIKILEEYKEIIEPQIIDVLNKDTKNSLTFDILDSEQSRKYKLLCLKQKQYQMKIGEIWQIVIGNYKSFKNLYTHHISGLDIISNDRKIIMELKNRTNTDNHSSKKQNLLKLSNFKKLHPEYTCVYGCINDDTEDKTIKGSSKTIIYNDVEIEVKTGLNLLKFIFEENTENVIEMVKQIINSNLIL